MDPSTHIVGAVALSLVLTLPTGAAAQPVPAPTAAIATPSSGARLAVITPRIDPPQPGLAEQVLTALATPLRERAIELIAADEVARVADGACEDTACLTRLAAELGATHVLRTVVTRDGRDYGLRIELRVARDGSLVAAIDEPCELCGLGELRAQISDEATRIAAKLLTVAAPAPELVLTTRPAGAEVRIDGRLVGLTPLRRPLIAGTHTVELTLAGHDPERRSITAASGERAALTVTLRRSRAQLRLRASGVALLATGAALLAGGVALAALDGRCQGAPEHDIAGNCHRVFNTDWGGAGLVVGGAALGTAGVVLLVRTRDRSQAPRLRAGFGAASLRLAF